MTSGFAERLAPCPPRAVAARLAAATARDVRRVLEAERIGPGDAPVLFSPAAVPLLEPLAERARATTLARFGRTMTLYTPIYLSSHCVNRCAYCGFAAHRTISRRRLECQEAVAQVEHLRAEGMGHVLLVTGEAPREYGLRDICDVVAAIRHRVASVAVEIFPCDLEGYQQLVQAGVDGLVLYQETYDPQRYAELHLGGPKRNFENRLAAMEAGGRAGFRSLGIGALLGLAPPRVEATMVAWHAAFLEHKFPRSRLAVSFPRLRPVSGGTPVLHPIGDADLAQLIVGTRLMLPDAEIVISTREPASLRDHLMPLGVTRMSAGSRTSPGAYGRPGANAETGQFAPDDLRSVSEVLAAVRRAGLDPVTKDFDAGFLSQGAPP